MAMAFSVPRFTTRELERLPDDGQRYELLDGLLLVTPAPSERHQLIATRLVVSLSRCLEGRPAIRVVGPGVIARDPDSELHPDVLVYQPDGPVETDWRGPRTWWLAVEIFSRTSMTYDRMLKRGAYLALGVAEVWLVDPWEAAVYVSRPGGMDSAGTQMPDASGPTGLQPASGAIHVAPMPNLDHDHSEHLIVNLVQNPVVPLPNPVAFLP
jgi:Uma2 family endonuclease